MSIFAKTSNRFVAQAVLLASSASLLACTQLKQMTEMHDATVEMRDSTREMNGRMKDMGNDTKSMGGTTNNMDSRMSTMGVTTEDLRDLSKQGVTLQIREQTLDKVFNAQSQVEKLSKAAKYFMSFEYQLFNGKEPHFEELRQEQAASAAREFMREIQRFVHADTANVVAIASPEAIEKLKAKPDYAPLIPQVERDSNINAFAVAMHVLNPRQEEMLRDGKAKKLSMYIMIQDAFQANAEIEAGKKRPEDFPAYVAEIRSFLDIAAVLLRARANALGAMSLARVSTVLTSADPMLRLQEMTEGWTFETDKANSKVIRDAALYLDASVKTLDFMKSVSVDADEVGSSKPLFAKAKQTDEMQKALKTATQVTSRAKLTERDAAFVEFLEKVEAYTK